MILLSGLRVREKIVEELKSVIASNKQKPKLSVIQVGENYDSDVYIKQKIKFGKEIGVETLHIKLPEDISEENVLLEIKKLNEDESISGIIVQLPLPKNINARVVLDFISPQKDVDGLGSFQVGKFYSGEKSFISATAKGIISLLNYYSIDLFGKNVVVVGRSNLVGKPISYLCLQKDATVTICHSKTKDLPDKTKKADILIVACGVPKMINQDFVKKDQVVVDVGIHRTESGLCGDVDFEDVKDIVYAITPVPGGVGPLTVTSLFQNVVDAKLSL